MRQVLPSDIDFFALVGSLRKGIRRIEALDQYGVLQEDAEFQSYLSGDFTPPNELETDVKWCELLRHYAKTDAPISRIRVVPENLTPYIRYEMEWGFNKFAGEGEDIRIVVKEKNADIQVSWENEIYILDDSRVIFIVYDHEGRFLRLEEETSGEAIAKCNSDYRMLLSRSIPYKAFLSARRQAR